MRAVLPHNRGVHAGRDDVMSVLPDWKGHVTGGMGNGRRGQRDNDQQPPFDDIETTSILSTCIYIWLEVLSGIGPDVSTCRLGHILGVVGRR